MDRFSLILTALPSEPSLELLAELRSLAWSDGKVPAVLVTGISDSEARIRKTDLEFLGGEYEILKDEEAKKLEQTEKPAVKEVEEISFEKLSLESPNTPLDLKLAPAVEEEEVKPIWELSIDDSSSTLEPSPPAAPPVITKPQEEELSQFSFSLEEEDKPELPQTPATPPAVTVVSPPEIKSAPTLTFDLESSPEEIPSPPPPPAVATPVVPVAPIKEEFATEETTKTEISEESSSASPDIEDENEVAGTDEDLDDWSDEEEEADLLPAPPPRRTKGLVLGGSLLIVCLLAGYTFFGTSPTPAPGGDDGSGMINALLTEQERIAKEERKAAYAAQKKVDEKPGEIIAGTFPIQLSDGAIHGEISFGRYQAGLLIDSLKIVEEKQQKISPQDLAAGKTPRPWLKSFEVEMPSISAREALGANYKFKSETRAYVEDSTGTLRVPCVLELVCQFRAGANLNCSYDIKNKALIKKTGETSSTASETSSAEAKPPATVPKKTQLIIEREASLGFLVLISGEFQAKLNPR